MPHFPLSPVRSGHAGPSRPDGLLRSIPSRTSWAPSLVGLLVTAGLVLGHVAPARAAEALEPDADNAPDPRDHGFTFGLHLGVGYPFLDATPNEQHKFASTLGARFGYRFARWLAVYVDGTGFFSLGGSDASISFAKDGTPYGGEAITAVGIASVPVAVRPLSWLEISAAPALGVHAGNLVGGAVGHLAFPIRLKSVTLSPTVETTGLTSKLWSQVALTGGLGIDW